MITQIKRPITQIKTSSLVICVIFLKICVIKSLMGFSAGTNYNYE